jgi:predicted alpha/beta-hydrolase family hydrolase
VIDLLLNRARRARATLLLAHGAGAPMDSTFMSALAADLCAQGITVARFEFPYMAARRQSDKRAPPNRIPVLVQSFHEALETLRSKRVLGRASKDQTPRLFIGGKSMGGRVATMIADALTVRGVIVLGYPFHPPGRPDKLRVEHLRAMSTPCLIAQGTRDALGSRDEVGSYTLSDRIALHWLEDGDHSLEPRRASGRTSAQNWHEAACAIAAFVERQR